MLRTYSKIGKGMSFPHALSGNPDETTTGCPIKTFGHDNFGITFRKFLITVFLLSISGPVWAIPPSKIELQYDPEKKNLHIAVEHVTRKNRKHYIRYITVYKNDQEIESFHYVVQEKPSGVSEDLALEANKDDVIRVKAQCTESGPKEETLTIP